MPVVNKTLLDGDGSPFVMQFWDGGDGALRPLHRISGSNAAGDDVTGTGNDATVDLGVSVNYVDFYNGGDETATISDGTETRSIPSGQGRLCEFTTAAQSFAVVADGAWIATPMQ